MMALGSSTAVYSTDGYLNGTWNDANTVSGNNNVLSQTEYIYDKDSNVTLVTTRERFDNETQGDDFADNGCHRLQRNGRGGPVGHVSTFVHRASAPRWGFTLSPLIHFPGRFPGLFHFGPLALGKMGGKGGKK